MRSMVGETQTISAFVEARRTGSVSQEVDHAHPQLEFNLVVSGRATYFLEDNQHDLVPGTLVWLLPGQPHRLIRSPDFDMWMVMCDRDGLDDAFIASVAEHPCRVLSTEDAVALDRLLAHISQDVEDPSVYKSGLKYAVRSAHYASRTTPGPVKKRLHSAVLKALAILRSNAESPTLSMLAKMCNVNQDYLGQLLSEQTGRGFVEWRNRTRVERFHILYPDSGDLLTAALAAGFGSYAQFHRVFVDLIGATPGEWARSKSQARLLMMPVDASNIRAGPGGSTRMACYALCGLSFPIISRHFGRAFATAMAESDPGRAHEAVPSETVLAEDLRQHEEFLADDLQSIDQAAATSLRRIFAQSDLIQAYVTGFPYNWPIADLSYTLGMYLMYAWVITNRRPYPKVEQVLQVIRRTRDALHISTTLEKADPLTRQRLTAAFVVQIMMIRNAAVGMSARSNNEDVERMIAKIHGMVLSSLGIDLRALDLID
jgi:AraC-like DNA-binding protein